MERSHPRTTAPRLSVRLIVPVLLLPALTSLATAQSAGAISGTVRDSTGAPIPGVEIVIVAPRAHVRSDSTGAFRFAAVPAGKREVSFRRLGFEPQTVNAAVVVGETFAMAVVLAPFATEIEGMTVQEVARRRQLLSDFFDRSERGFGHFITRDQIEKRNPMNLSDMLRMVPGARLIPSRTGGTATLRFARATMGRDCPPQYWVDGVKTWALNIDDIVPQDVEGIEIYSGASTVPAQYNTKEGTTICGVVLIWTRIPGT